MSRKHRFAVAAALAAGVAVIVHKVRTNAKYTPRTAPEVIEQVDPRHDGLVTHGAPGEETDERLAEGDQRAELDEQAYEIVVDEYGTDASIKSNILDREGVEPFDEELVDEYRPTLQVTDASRFILQTGTSNAITEQTLDTFVGFREGGYRRILLVPESDVAAVKELVDTYDASITVCSPETLTDEL